VGDKAITPERTISSTKSEINETQQSQAPDVTNRSTLKDTSIDSDAEERHFTILYGDTGHNYESLLAPYITSAKTVRIEDPYVRMPHQIQNFVRFCESIVKLSAIKTINLVTGFDDENQRQEVADNLEDLKQSLLEIDVELNVVFDPNKHDREIRFDNGWVIKIGRGLDFYQKPDSWYDIGVNDLTLRRCLETKVDIFLDK
jgi:ATP-dependent Lon protease